MDSEVISIRVRRGTAEHLKKLGINSSEKAREYLEDLAWKSDARKTLNELEILVKKNSKPSKVGFAVKSIREDRYETH
jgi:replication-associated recombination protein RarA